MSCLAPEADRVVRTAVEDYFAGRLRPEIDGETVFETRHSKYRLMDGVLFSASDSSLIGAELVGWLIDSETTEPTILPTWIQGARAVLVDRARGRYIIVTSTARVVSEMHLDGSNDLRHGSNATHLPQSEGSVARRAGTLASEASGARKTPVPAPRPIPPCPPSPSRKITLSGALVPTPAAEVRTSSPPPAPSSPMFGAAVSRGPAMSAPPPTAIPDSPPLPRSMVHPPPRPIRRSPAPPPPASGQNLFPPPPPAPRAFAPPPQAHLAARPLPLPMPPPMRPMSSSHVASPRIAPPMSAPPPSVSIDDIDPTQRHDRRALPLSAPRVPASPPSAPIPLAQRRVTP